MHRSILLFVFGLALMGSGCAAWKPPLGNAPAGQVADTGASRHAAAVQAFEEQRDRALLDAAIDRWNQGDIAGCESRLRTVLSRRPSDIKAHVLLAELAWSQNDPAVAEAEYLAAIQLAPDRPDLEHALALILEATGRLPEAASHRTRAASLDPRNELYRL
jgi:Tfp pilus assembly protein PilF